MEEHHRYLPPTGHGNDDADVVVGDGGRRSMDSSKTASSSNAAMMPQRVHRMSLMPSSIGVVSLIICVGTSSSWLEIGERVKCNDGWMRLIRRCLVWMLVPERGKCPFMYRHWMGTHSCMGLFLSSIYGLYQIVVFPNIENASSCIGIHI